MFNFFRKKRKNIKEYIEYVDKSKIDFQLNIGCVLKETKQNRVDIQVFRQSVVEDFNYEVKDKDGYMLMLSFNEQKYNNLTNCKNFKQSLFYEDSLHVNIYGETYLIRVSSKFDLIYTINTLLKEVFKYSQGTVIFTQFEKL